MRLHGSNARVPTKAWLLLPAVVYAVVACFWHTAGLYGLAGDEAHYLFLTESIVRDGDFTVENNYAAHGVEPLDVDVVKTPHGWYSVHNVGLPLLLALPWALGGTLGAKLALCLFMGLVTPLLFRSIDRTLHLPRWSLLVALTLSLGMPLLGGANQIYPDLPAGLLLFFASDYVIEGASGKGSSRGRFAMFVAAVSFLPWLHIKHGLPALIVLAGQLAACRGDGRLRKLAAAAMLGGSLVVLAWYNHYAFGNLAGPYRRDQGLVFDLAANAMVFLGLHWDQAQGMFLQQPLLLLGLLGLGPMWRGTKWGLAWLALLGAAVLIPHCLHPHWYGGYSLVGRFAWSSVLLWGVPVAHGARWLLAWRREVLAAACVVCLALQVSSASWWLGCEGRLMGGSFETPLWAYNGLYPLLRNQLPFWHRFDLQWRHAPNYTFLLLGAGLVATGWLTLAPRRALLRATWIALAVVAVAIQSVPRPDDVLAISGAQVQGIVGEVQDQTRVAAELSDQAGLLSLLPHLFLAKGDYLVRASYIAEGNGVPSVGSLYIIFSPSDISVAVLQPTAAQRRLTSAAVHVDRKRARERTEVGVIYGGRGDLIVEHFSIERLRR